MIISKAKNKIEEYELRALLRDEWNLNGREKADTEFIIGKIIDSIIWNEKDKVLDIGPGNGYLGDSLKGRIKEYVGLDPVKDLITRNNEKFKSHPDAKFVVGYSDRIPFPDRYFHKVIMNGVLHFLRDMEQVRETLLEINRVLDTSGIAFLGEIPITREQKTESILTASIRFIWRKGAGRFMKTLWNTVRPIFTDSRVIIPSTYSLDFNVENFLILCNTCGLAGKINPHYDIYGKSKLRVNFLLRKKSNNG